MRIVIAIPSLHLGGAETQFVRVANGLHARGHDVTALTFSQGGELAAEIRGPRLVCLDKTSRLGNVAAFGSLLSLTKRLNPQVYYGFLPLPNVMGAALRLLRPNLRLVFGLRASDMRLEVYGLAARCITALEARASTLADAVVCNSRAGFDHAQAIGYPPARLHVIHNGIDTASMIPDRALGAALRSQWGVAPANVLIGLVARLDPMKDHANFLLAAKGVLERHPETRFVCVGTGPKAYADALRRQALDLGLGSRLLWAGQRVDMSAVYNALDILCLSSRFGEGFPNVLGEAMSCGVPCVSTDVGDAPAVLGETGQIVPRRDAEALAQGLSTMTRRIESQGEALARACRARVLKHFRCETMVERSEALLLDLCRGGQ